MEEFTIQVGQMALSCAWPDRRPPAEAHPTLILTPQDSAKSFISALAVLGVTRYSLVGDGAHGVTAAT